MSRIWCQCYFEFQWGVSVFSAYFDWLNPEVLIGLWHVLLRAFCGNARKQTYSLVFFPYFVHLSLKMIEAPPKKDCCGEVINRRRLPHLTEEEKAKVEALKITGLSNPDVARSMGMSLSSVKRRKQSSKASEDHSYNSE